MMATSHNKNTQLCHDHENCAHGAPKEIDQTLDEIKFEKSIFNACVIGDLEKIKLLVNKHGSSILNQQDKNGYSGLHYAARNSHYEICKYLIENNVNVNIKTFSCESTALHRAAFIGNEKVVQLLLENKATGNLQDCDGKTSLHKCIEQYIKNNSENFKRTINILLKHDSSLLEIRDKKNKTPLDYCPDLIKNSLQ